jgi:hypothetical protein
VGFVPGVTLRKWRTVWEERFPRVPLETIEVTEEEQRRALLTGAVDLCLVRLPLDTDALHLIPLYEEVCVAWSSKDHPLEAVTELTLEDLAGEVLLTSPTPDAIQQAAFADAVLLVPMSIARTFSRRDMVYRPVTDAPTTRIGLAWRADDERPWIAEFVGVVRGRTANSSRTASERAAQSGSAGASGRTGQRQAARRDDRRPRRGPGTGRGRRR